MLITEWRTMMDAVHEQYAEPEEEDAEPAVPNSLEEWKRYDVVVLGRRVQDLVNAGQLAQLTAGHARPMPLD